MMWVPIMIIIPPRGRTQVSSRTETMQPCEKNRKRELKAHEVVAYLDPYALLGNSKIKFCKDKHIDNTQLKRWLKNEARHRAAAAVITTSLRRNQSVVNESVGNYPAMEFELDVTIRVMRSIGMVVESWVLEYEGKMAFHKVYPDLHPDEPCLDGGDDDHQYPLIFSDTWKHDFMKRHNSSFRKVGKRMNKKDVTENAKENIR